MDFPKKRMGSTYRSWLILEIFKVLVLFTLLVFPEFVKSKLYYLIFIVFFLSFYSLYRTFPLFKYCLGRSIFEEYEPKRLIYAKYRNYVCLIMVMDIFPFFLFPPPILKFIY